MQLYSPLQLIYSPLKLIYLAALLSSAADLLSEADLSCSSTPPLQLIYSPLKLIYLAALLSSAVDLLPLAVGLPRSSTPPLAADLLYLQHNSPSTRQYTDFPCSRSLTQQRQAET